MAFRGFARDAGARDGGPGIALTQSEPKAESKMGTFPGRALMGILMGVLMSAGVGCAAEITFNPALRDDGQKLARERPAAARGISLQQMDLDSLNGKVGEIGAFDSGRLSSRDGRISESCDSCRCTGC